MASPGKDVEYHKNIAKHRKVVVAVAKVISVAYGVDDSQLESLAEAARMHDIGYEALPRGFFDKPHSLEEAQTLVKQSIDFEFHTAKQVLGEQNAKIVLHQHERFDGTGFPMGLKGKSIPLEARILAVACAYDLFYFKSYANNPNTDYALEQTIQKIKADSGTHFDPEVVDALVFALNLIMEKTDKEFDAESTLELIRGQRKGN